MQADGLVTRDISPAFAVAADEFGVEGPCDDCAEDEIVGSVDVVLRREGHKEAVAGCGAHPADR